jgi:hypothetical protein
MRTPASRNLRRAIGLLRQGKKAVVQKPAAQALIDACILLDFTEVPGTPERVEWLFGLAIALEEIYDPAEY